MSFSLFLTNFYEGMLVLYRAVVSDLSLLWLLVPVFILWSATEIYYGEYAKEKTGFSSTFTGALSLLWLCFITLREVFPSENFSEIASYGLLFWIIAVLALYALFVLYASFRHVLSEDLLDVVASRRVLYFASFLLVFFGAGKIAVDFYAVFSVLTIFALISFVFSLIKKYWLAGFLGEVEAVKKAGAHL